LFFYAFCFFIFIAVCFRDLFCWIDEWHGLTDEALQEYIELATQQLTQNFDRGGVVGMLAEEDKTK